MALKLFGTLSGRLSGKAAKMPQLPQKHQTGANGVTMPFGHQVYGKTVKQMFIAPPGKVLCYVDYNNLEGHISGILTKDPTKLAILNGEYEDMHSLHACYFFKPELEREFNLDLSNITPDIISELYHTDSFTSYRTKGKSVTFGLDYGSHPPLIAKTLGCSLVDAKGLFDRYHNDLYRGVSEFRDNYSTPTTKENGYLHLNYGLRLYSDDVDKDVRTIFNANFQGYTLLTQIAAVEFRKFIIEHNLQDRIKAISIIHDSLTYEADEDPVLIEWINTNLIRLMCKQFVSDQLVQLHAEIDIGHSMAKMKTLPNNASIDTIKQILEQLSTNS